MDEFDVIVNCGWCTVDSGAFVALEILVNPSGRPVLEQGFIVLECWCSVLIECWSRINSQIEYLVNVVNFTAVCSACPFLRAGGALDGPLAQRLI